jgi:membrane-associated protein
MELLSDLVSIVLHLDQHLDRLIPQYGPWVYGLLFLIVFCETGLVVTPFLPGDSLLFAVGTIAARGSLDVWWAAGLLAVAAITGDAANYWAGRFLGAELLRPGRTRLIRQEHVDRTHEFYERHGAKTIVLARFVPIIRTFAPFVAGFGRMTYGRFTLYNVSGGVLWICLFVVGGYYFGNIPMVKDNFGLAIIAIILISFIPMALAFVRDRARTR